VACQPKRGRINGRPGDKKRPRKITAARLQRDNDYEFLTALALLRMQFADQADDLV
jgi:hypothetical protein